MAYDSFAARVECDGQRMQEREGVPCFGGLRQYHAVLGEGDVRLALYKTGLPELYVKGEEGIQLVDIGDPSESVSGGFAWSHEVNGCSIRIREAVKNGRVIALKATLTEASGKRWEAEVRRKEPSETGKRKRASVRRREGNP